MHCTRCRRTTGKWGGDAPETSDPGATLAAVMTSSARPSIGLVMIVRDESRVIERCLDSVRPLVSSWTICDTGSTDGTPELIERVLSDLPGRLLRHEWVDFGTNRTWALEAARATADYLLLLDADQTIRLTGELPELELDSYLVRHDGDLDYAIPRLIRGDIAWRFEGSTHEYLAADTQVRTTLLRELVVVHHGDGGSKADKFERDRRLLERDLTARPDDPRATFYLANTLRDLGERERAIELFRRRVSLGGWDEEVFVASLEAGRLLASAGSPEAPGQLLDAWGRRPTRAEPLHELARLFRDRGDHETAYLFARRGLDVPYPQDILFVRRDVHEWALLLELSIAAYWTGRHPEALAACDRLLAIPSVPDEARRQVNRNRDHVLTAMGRPPEPHAWVARPWGAPRLSELDARVRVGRVLLDVEPSWPALNPSIASDGDGFRLLVRTANYEIDAAGGYRSLDDSGTIATLNYVARLDADLALTDLRPIVDANDGPPPLEGPVRGYEDCRLFAVDGRWYATATVRDRDPGALCRIALLWLDENEIRRVDLLPGPVAGRHEKNWMPFLRDGSAHLLYWTDPVVVGVLDPDGGSLGLAAKGEQHGLPVELRGGSQGVRVEEGWLFVVHEVLWGDGGRTYRHRFLLLDEGLRLAGLSRPFSFQGERIEFCAGMAARGDELVLSFGVMDREAWLAVLPRAAALALIEPLVTPR